MKINRIVWRTAFSSSVSGEGELEPADVDDRRCVDMFPYGREAPERLLPSLLDPTELLRFTLLDSDAESGEGSHHTSSKGKASLLVCTPDAESAISISAP